MKIICIAYACEPGKGSEPEAGWNLAHLLADLAETWVVTRANNRATIEAAVATEPERSRPRFVYVDLPARARFWKRGHRGVRLYYMLWQRVALRRIRALHREEQFDAVWHLTLANAWLGSVGSLTGIPFIYGPVGGGLGVSWPLFPSLGSRGMLYEVLRSVVRATARLLNPLARLSWIRAERILVQNAETRDWFPEKHRGKATVHTNAVMDPLPPAQRDPGTGSTAIFAGRLLAWKGAHLAIEAISMLPSWRLVVFGDGPDRARLRRITRRLGVGQQVEFRGWTPRLAVLHALRTEADVLLFPSAHEDGGLVVAESLAAGVPVVCLAAGGPAALGASGVRIGRRRATVRRLAEGVSRSVESIVPRPPTVASHRERLSAVLAGLGRDEPVRLHRAGRG